MSFFTLSGVFLKLSRLILKIYKWVLVKMSLNCKLPPGTNSKLSANFKVKKANEPLHGSNCRWIWRALLSFMFLLVLVGLIWFISCSNDGGFRKNGDTRDLREDKPGILLEQFNVSKEQLDVLASTLFESDQITSLKCTKQSELEILPCSSSSINCALVVSTLRNQGFEKQHGWDVKNVEWQDQCPVRDNTDPPFEEKKSVSVILQSTTSSTQSNCQISEAVETF